MIAWKHAQLTQVTQRPKRKDESVVSVRCIASVTLDGERALAVGLNL